MSGEASDSVEQRAAEHFIIEAVGRHAGAELQKRRLALYGGSWMELDGYAAKPPTLCEAWAHVGPAKPGQRKKVMTDALKLHVARSEFGSPEDCRAILGFCDEDVASHFRGTSWMAQALRQLEIEVLVVEVRYEIRASILAAQRRQYR